MSECQHRKLTDIFYEEEDESHAEIFATCADCGRKWLTLPRIVHRPLELTDEKPTRSGFYWYLAPGDGTPCVRHLNAAMEDMWTHESVDDLPGQWAGPLEPPV